MCVRRQKRLKEVGRCWKIQVATVPSNSAWPTPTMMMDMGSFAPWRDREKKICQLQNNSIEPVKLENTGTRGKIWAFFKIIIFLKNNWRCHAEHSHIIIQISHNVLIPKSLIDWYQHRKLGVEFYIWEEFHQQIENTTSSYQCSVILSVCETRKRSGEFQKIPERSFYCLYCRYGDQRHSWGFISTTHFSH